ncbi:eukaryotic translation initiation factor 3 subunit J-like [Mytilus californianus]|uniref:eukaryotic translation initiation factor 3 subunit J-like n=1 Tax=Mytilus californianus TaxID=6549 RepID=UPI00224542F6|nr:eukaryotic translation initiation factor 3 subunit J-like [Mytilus californianus]
MSDEWDAEDFEPELPVKTTDQWEGEDEDDVKDNWEDDDDEEKKSEQKDGEGKLFQRKKKKLADRIAEKQAAKLAAEEAEQEKNRKLTPEEEIADKLKKQRLQEESDLQLAKEAFGVNKGSGIDGMFPEDEEGFEKFGEAIKNKITIFEKSKHYCSFLEKLFTDLVVSLEAEDCRKLGQNLTNIYHEKQKIAKEMNKKKKKSKITLKSERDNDFNDLAASSSGNYGFDDLDEDFI